MSNREVMLNMKQSLDFNGEINASKLAMTTKNIRVTENTFYLVVC